MPNENVEGTANVANGATTTNTTIVNFGTYSYQTQKWKTFVERLEQQFQQNDISNEDKKRAILISCFDEDTYEAIKGLSNPIVPGTMTYADLKQVCDDNFAIPTVTFVERRNFYEAQKDAGESCQQFIIRMRNLAITCEFGDRLEAMLVDKFVINMPSKIFDKLCDVENLTIKKAIEIAKKFEKKNNPDHDHDQVNFYEKDKLQKTGISKEKVFYE